jgi:hypothetical protein
MAWPSGGNPYLAHLFGKHTGLVVRSTTAPFGTTGDFSVLPGGSYLPIGVPDQPTLSATRVGGQDQIFVTINDLSQPLRTASIEYSLDGGVTFTRKVIEKVNPALGFDLPPVESAVNGTSVYAVYERVQGVTGAVHENNQRDFVVDVVVVKDDLTSPTFGNFDGLGTNGVGVVIASNVIAPLGLLGQERLGSDLAIAISPDGSQIYVAFAVSPNFDRPTVQVYQSSDGGQTWPSVYGTRDKSALPVLAVAQNGAVGLMYTSYEYGNLETHFTQTLNNFGNVGDTILSRFFDPAIAIQFDPYIGDFERVVAVGNTFYGTFSAGNDTSLYLTQPTFLRDASMLGHGVAFSIDPFYYSINAITSTPTLGPGPTAVDDVFSFPSITANQPLELNLCIHDFDPSGDAVSINTLIPMNKDGSVGSENPVKIKTLHGTAERLGTGAVTYTPDSTFKGTDSFYYTVVNSVRQSPPKNLVTINAALSPLAGTYSGVAVDSSSGQNEPALITMTVTKKGNATGTLRLGASSYSFAGEFTLQTADDTVTGAPVSSGAVFIVNRPSQTPITLSVQIALPSGAVTGTLGDGGSSTAFTLQPQTVPAGAGVAGLYNAWLLHDSTNQAAGTPHGDGYVAVTVDKTSHLRAVGTLADGTKFSQGTTFVNNGIWPLYAAVYGQAGAVGGTVQFTGTSLASSAVSWVKPAGKATASFGAGFATTLTLQGAEFISPPAGQSIILDATTSSAAGAASFDATASTTAVTQDFSISSKNVITPSLPNSANLVLTINAATGYFSGTFTPPSAPKALSYSGLIIPSMNQGNGFFLTPAGSGTTNATASGALVIGAP